MSPAEQQLQTELNQACLIIYGYAGLVASQAVLQAQLKKLLAAPEPVSMPREFAAALTQLRVLQAACATS